MNELLTGVEYLVEGFRLIAKPGIRRFVIIPVVINVLLFAVLFLVARHYMTVFDVWFNQLLPGWLQWLSWLIWLIFFVSFFLVMVYVFVTLANMIAAPFNGFLAEKVEFYLTGKIQEPRSLWENIKDVPRIIARQLSIILYYLPRAFFILLLLLVPILQAFVAIIGFVFHAWLMSLTYVDYPSDNHRVSLRDVRFWLEERRLASLGFGASVLMASMVPILNLFTIPAAVAGATKFWLDRRDMGRGG